MGMSTSHTSEDLFEQSILRQANRILSDPSDVLNSENVLMTFGKSHNVPLCKHNCYKHPFVTPSVKMNDWQLCEDRHKGGDSPRKLDGSHPPLVFTIVNRLFT